MKTINRWQFLKHITIGFSSAGAVVLAIERRIDRPLMKMVHRARSQLSEVSETRELRPGDPIPQLFRAKVPIRGYSLGAPVGFEIVNLNWAYPFWQNATIADGCVICNFAVGCVQDVGKIYQITGFVLPPGLIIPDGELKQPINGTKFFGPSRHCRV